MTTADLSRTAEDYMEPEIPARIVREVNRVIANSTEG